MLGSNAEMVWWKDLGEGRLLLSRDQEAVKEELAREITPFQVPLREI